MKYHDKVGLASSIKVILLNLLEDVCDIPSDKYRNPLLEVFGSTETYEQEPAPSSPSTHSLQFMLLSVAYNINKIFPIKRTNEVCLKLLSVPITSPLELLHFIISSTLNNCLKSSNYLGINPTSIQVLGRALVDFCPGQQQIALVECSLTQVGLYLSYFPPGSSSQMDCYLSFCLPPGGGIFGIFWRKLVYCLPCLHCLYKIWNEFSSLLIILVLYTVWLDTLDLVSYTPITGILLPTIEKGWVANTDSSVPSTISLARLIELVEDIGKVVAIIISGNSLSYNQSRELNFITMVKML